MEEESKTASKEELILRPSKIPIITALKIGCANYRYHPIRLIVTILLAVFSFMFFGLSLAYGLMDRVNPLVNAIYDNNIEYVSLKYYETQEPEDKLTFEEFFTGIWHFQNMDPLFSWQLNPVNVKYDNKYTRESIEELQTHYSEQMEFAANGEAYFYCPSVRERTAQSVLNEKEQNIWTNNGFDGVMTIHEETIEKYGFELIGRLPQNKNEAVISESFYNYLMMYGLLDEETGREYEFTSPQDLIEQKIVLHDSPIGNDMLITGVLNTGCDYACRLNHGYEYIADNGKQYMETYQKLEDRNLYHCKLFVTLDFLLELNEHCDGEWDYAFLILCPVGKDKKEFRQFVKYIDNNNMEYKNKEGKYFDLASWRHTGVDSVICDFLDYKRDVFNGNKYFSVMMIYLGIIFFIFTFVFLINFITMSMQSQMKQIGIMSALGADFKKLFLVYLLSASILCGAVYLLTLLVTGIIIACLNSAGLAMLWVTNAMVNHPFNILTLNIWVILILFAAAAVTALVGTLIAMRKLRKLTPADIIRKGQLK